jgi:hypothetical protein
MTTVGETRVLPEDLATTREKLTAALAGPSPDDSRPSDISPDDPNPNVFGPGGR